MTSYRTARPSNFVLRHLTQCHRRNALEGHDPGPKVTFKVRNQYPLLAETIPDRLVRNARKNSGQRVSIFHMLADENFRPWFEARALYSWFAHTTSAIIACAHDHQIFGYDPHLRIDRQGYDVSEETIALDGRRLANIINNMERRGRLMRLDTSIDSRFTRKNYVWVIPDELREDQWHWFDRCKSGRHVHEIRSGGLPKTPSNEVLDEWILRRIVAHPSRRAHLHKDLILQAPRCRDQILQRLNDLQSMDEIVVTGPRRSRTPHTTVHIPSKINHESDYAHIVNEIRTLHDKQKVPDDKIDPYITKHVEEYGYLPLAELSRFSGIPVNTLIRKLTSPDPSGPFNAPPLYIHNEAITLKKTTRPPRNRTEYIFSGPNDPFANAKPHVPRSTKYEAPRTEPEAPRTESKPSSDQPVEAFETARKQPKDMNFPVVTNAIVYNPEIERFDIVTRVDGHKATVRGWIFRSDSTAVDDPSLGVNRFTVGDVQKGNVWIVDLPTPDGTTTDQEEMLEDLKEGDLDLDEVMEETRVALEAMR